MPAQETRRGTMLDLARQWRDSGRKAREFAEEHGVTPWTLYYWRKRLAREERRPRRRRRRPPRVTLAPVQVVADGRAGELEILLAGGDRVRVSADVPAETLQRVIQVLRTAC